MLEGTSHNVSMKKLAPVLAEIFAGKETQPSSAAA
jgi:hypothetical protein